MGPARTSSRIGTAAYQTFWAIILGVHILPLVRVSMALATTPGDLERWGSLGALMLAMAFFGAKAVGVRWLRFSSRLMGAVLFLVACGIVHGDRVAGEHSAAAAIAITTTATAVVAVRHRKKIAEALSGVGAARDLIRAPLAVGFVSPEPAPVLRRIWLQWTAPPRGPPLHNSI